MKKVWIGLGIGFGVVVLVVVVALVAGGLWLKSKVEGVAEDAQAFAAESEAAEQRARTLDERFAFTAPAKGVPVAVTESRLHDYLAIRATLQPVWKTYEAKSKELEASMEGEQAGFGDALKAMGHLGGFLNTLRTTWLDGLEGKRMSPREYHAITAALYSSNWGVAIADMKGQQRPAFEEMKKALETQLASTTDAEIKQALEAQLTGVKEQLAALPAVDQAPGEAEKVHRANHELYRKYQAQIEAQAAQGLDLLLVGDEGGGLGEAFENVHVGDEAEEN